jgi:hypothetical protein
MEKFRLGPLVQRKFALTTKGTAVNHQNRKDARSVTKHAGAASVGVTQPKPGHKLGSRLRRDIVGEGPKKRGTAFDPINTALSDADQSAAFNNSGGRE